MGEQRHEGTPGTADPALGHEVTRPVRLADGETVWGQIAISNEQRTEHSRAWHRVGAVSVGGWGAHVEDTAVHTKGELSSTVGPDLVIPMPSGLLRTESGHCHAFPPAHPGKPGPATLPGEGEGRDGSVARGRGRQPRAARGFSSVPWTRREPCLARGERSVGGRRSQERSD